MNFSGFDFDMRGEHSYDFSYRMIELNYLTLSFS